MAENKKTIIKQLINYQNKKVKIIMKKRYIFSFIASITLLLLAGCGQNNQKKDTGSSDKEGTLKVVTTFTIIEDIARQIGGSDVDVYNLVPTGAAPHEYEPLPNDMKKTSDADILFYNGLNLEGGKKGWFFRMINSVGQKEENAYSLTEGIEPLYLSDRQDREEDVNPHQFISPSAGIIMAKNMRDILIERDPANKENYIERADNYLEKLEAIDQEYREKIAAIPEERRTLVTSEHAFQYMTKEYGLNEAYIWSIDTEETGTSEPIKALISFIKKNNVPMLFVESNVDERPMLMVSRETQVSISKTYIYADELSKPGGEVDTYIKFLQHNIDLIYEELK